ncbi:hypothetical protein Pla52n_11770 [Stieleria varia]|uniref:Uncharacterized protein n=1 Tax=Stieleria varia TaxID=2528005 RepID=A0A5C6AZI1_9BACT|nr:hypothetical protein Pla52n_11770 [Stieleria varia]
MSNFDFLTSHHQPMGVSPGSYTVETDATKTAANAVRLIGLKRPAASTISRWALAPVLTRWKLTQQKPRLTPYG